MTSTASAIATWCPLTRASASRGAMSTLVPGCTAWGSTVVTVTPVGATAAYSLVMGENSPMSMPLSVSRGEPCVDRIGHVVAVDAAVVLVRDVHHAAVGQMPRGLLLLACARMSSPKSSSSTRSSLIDPACRSTGRR